MKRLSLYLFAEHVVKYCNYEQLSIKEIVKGLQNRSFFVNKNYSVSDMDIETFYNDYKKITIDHYNTECYHYGVNEEYFN